MRLIPWFLGVALILPAADVLAGGGPCGAGKFREEMAANRAAAFAEADADDSGGLNVKEFAAFQELVQSGRRGAIFNRLDSDENGEVSKQELDDGAGKRRGRRGGRRGGLGW